MRRLTLATLGALAILGAALPASAETGLKQHWGFQSPFGTYDKASLQIGFATFEANCASCHGLSMVRFRDLGQFGLSPQDVAAITAATKIRKGVDAKGKPVMMPATANDRMESPFATARDAAARNGGAVPGDLSLVAAEHRHGADFVYSLLMGYRPAPPQLALLPGHYYNIGWPGGQLAMPPSLKPGSVKLADGKSPSPRVMAHDVAEFLAWSADPTRDERKSVGTRILIFLIVFGVLGGLAISRRNRA